jgi:hypothetical protein
MHYQILSTQSITADDPAVQIALPVGLPNNARIAYTFAPSRAVNVELRNTAAGGGAYTIPEDSALADNYSTPAFVAATAPRWLFAASSQALTLTIALVIP